MKLSTTTYQIIDWQGYYHRPRCGQWLFSLCLLSCFYHRHSSFFRRLHQFGLSYYQPQTFHVSPVLQQPLHYIKEVIRPKEEYIFYQKRSSSGVCVTSHHCFESTYIRREKKELWTSIIAARDLHHLFSHDVCNMILACIFSLCIPDVCWLNQRNCSYKFVYEPTSDEIIILYPPKLTMPLCTQSPYQIIFEVQIGGLIQFQVIWITVQHIKELCDQGCEIWTLLRVCSPTPHHHIPAEGRKLSTILYP